RARGSRRRPDRARPRSRTGRDRRGAPTRASARPSRPGSWWGARCRRSWHRQKITLDFGRVSTNTDRVDDVQPQDLVITLLGAYVHPREATVWSGGLVQLLGEFGFSTGAARVALARLVRRDLLEPRRDGRLVHYALT